METICLFVGTTKIRHPFLTILLDMFFNDQDETHSQNYVFGFLKKFIKPPIVEMGDHTNNLII